MLQVIIMDYVMEVAVGTVDIIRARGDESLSAWQPSHR